MNFVEEQSLIVYNIAGILEEARTIDELKVTCKGFEMTMKKKEVLYTKVGIRPRNGMI